jgi:hypothetical protein
MGYDSIDGQSYSFVVAHLFRNFEAVFLAADNIFTPGFAFR